ncbi:Phage integrase domain-containing protein, partial [Aphis craccivora]
FDFNRYKKFIDEAPNIQNLVTKVVLIFGITGACRREELNFGSMLHIKLPYTKTNCSRSFTIEGEFKTRKCIVR